MRDLKNAGVPIDGVGLQCHLGLGNTIAGSDLATLLQSYADLGLLVAITEFDMSLSTSSATPAADLVQQAKAYQTYLSACLSAPNCISFSVWGVDDKDSWIPASFPGFGQPLIFDSNYAPKQPLFNQIFSRLQQP